MRFSLWTDVLRAVRRYSGSASRIGRRVYAAGPRPASVARPAREQRVREATLALRGAHRSPLLEELRESRIVPEVGERRVDAQILQLAEPPVEGLGQPGEGVVQIAVKGVDPRRVVGGLGIGGTCFGPFHGAGDLLLLLGGETFVPTGGVEAALGRRVAQVTADRLLELGDGFVVEAVTA